MTRVKSILYFQKTENEKVKYLGKNVHFTDPFISFNIIYWSGSFTSFIVHFETLNVWEFLTTQWTMCFMWITDHFVHRSFYERRLSVLFGSRITWISSFIQWTMCFIWITDHFVHRSFYERWITDHLNQIVHWMNDKKQKYMDRYKIIKTSFFLY